jgi:hypothetical protein
MSSIDKAVMLEALGWSRGGKASYRDKESQDRNQSTHLPDDIVRLIHEFTFFDVRSEAYREHLLKEDIKSHKLHVLDYILYELNYGLRRCETGKYGVDYTSINIGNKCCTMCGEFVPVWGDPNPENIRCSCRFISEEEIMGMEHEREDNYFWEEEIDNEREKERRRKNREEFGDNWWCDCDSDSSYEDYETYLIDDDYSDRHPNWDGE